MAVLALCLVSVQLAAQTAIDTDGDVEAQGFIGDDSLVTSVNADQVDGIEGADLALEADLSSAEAMLVALQAQVDALGLALVPRTGQTTHPESRTTLLESHDLTALQGRRWKWKRQGAKPQRLR